jgi:hypothetical protein
VEPGDVISYLEMCREEGVNLQAGMNFQLRGRRSVVLMSVRPGAPYADRVEENGRVLIYEGHDEPRRKGGPDPKAVDQPLHHPGGGLTQNGRFWEAAEAFKSGTRSAEEVRVYEKLRTGIWVFAGVFLLVDAWDAPVGGRRVFRFKLEITDRESSTPTVDGVIEHTRLIPTSVKLEVWARDGGRCVTCGSNDNLHFDHVIPYSRGGTSLVAENIQLLCARHNLAKSARLE